jgi:soluble lytic murein transglycosylase
VHRGPSAALAVALSLGILLATASAGRAQIYTRKNSNGVVEATNVPDAADFRLTYPGKGTLIHSRGFRGYYSGEYDPHISAAASLYNVSADLIKAVIAVESEFDQWAVSSKGAQGLMQLMPTTARHVGIENPFDPRENILGGTRYLSTLLDRFKGNTARALAAYNAGPTVVARHSGLPPYRETQGYVRKIQKLVQNTDAEFSLPVSKVRKASLRTRASRKAAISRNAARSKSTVRKAPTRSVVKKASTPTAKKPVRRASRRG